MRKSKPISEYIKIVPNEIFTPTVNKHLRPIQQPTEDNRLTCPNCSVSFPVGTGKEYEGNIFCSKPCKDVWEQDGF